nr:MAG TPA: hypothetical protein [Caudoviricetes sp.]
MLTSSFKLSMVIMLEEKFIDLTMLKSIGEF